VLTSSPSGCSGGSPILSQTCTVVQPNTFGINAGGAEYTASDGTIYQSDNYYNAGANYAYGTSNAIAGTTDDFLYQSERWADEDISYSIPVENGTYDITLKFAEIYWNSANVRVFNVNLEGQRILTNIDLYTLVGANTAYDQTYTRTITDGTINIDLIYTGIDNPKINAIKIKKGTTPPLTCTSFTYTPWSLCISGLQTRSILTALPLGCTGGTPILEQECTITPETCTSFTYSNWSTCTNGTQTRTILTSSPTGCTGGTPVLSQTCTMPNTAPSVDSGPDQSVTLPNTLTLTGTASDDGLPTGSTLTTTWSKVSGTGTVSFSNTHTLTTTATFSTAGTYVLKLSATDGTLTSTNNVTITVNAAPTPTCTSFTYSTWTPTTCTTGTQTRTVLTSSPTGCIGGTPITTQTCTIVPQTCTSFTYSEWSTCSNGTQTRTVLTSSPSGCTGGTPVLSQTCSTIPVPTNGLVAYYPFSGNMLDESGNNNNGTCTGTKCPTLTTDINENTNSAYLFKTKYITLGDIDLTGDFTLSFWMKPTSFPTSGAYKSVVMKFYDYGCELAGGKIILCYVADQPYNWSATTSATGLVANKWYNVTLTYSGTTLNLYLDGTLKQTATGTHTTTDYPLLVGSWNGTSEYFTGTIDTIRIYNRALTQTEINTIYQTK
jgi:hypothetical protein